VLAAHPSPSAPPDPDDRWVGLLVAHPELAAGVDPDEREDARRAVVVPAATLVPGPWDGTCAGTRPFAVVVLDGLMARECRLAGRVSRHIAGHGDVIGLESPAEDSVGALRWHVETPTRIAVLDRRFVAAVARWPVLVADVVRRAACWADRASVLQAIGHLPRVEDRILALLWHLADHWGRVGPAGVVVPLRLSHAALGSLVGARRPTVSIALAELQQRGTVTRRGEEWVLDPASRAWLDGAVADGRDPVRRPICELPRRSAAGDDVVERLS
jgi:hypothetical protein